MKDAASNVPTPHGTVRTPEEEALYQSGHAHPGEYHSGYRGLAPAWKKGQSGNPNGASRLFRFKAALLRELKKRKRKMDVDEYDQIARRVVNLITKNDTAAARILLELWDREDGPVETRVAGVDGNALTVHIVHEVCETTPEPSEANAERANRKN